MSEFKFACPVCGQHITADSSAAGSELDCPTCFRRIVVPQGRASDSKLVLSAIEANKRRSSGTIYTPASVAAPRPQSHSRKAPMFAGILAGIICVASLAFLLLKKNEPDGSTDGTSATDNLASSATMPSGTVQWTLDLSDATYPAETAFGKINGRDFVCDRAVLQGGILNLRMGREWPPELGLSVTLYARQAHELSGRSAVINTNNIRSPRITLRWKQDGTNQTEVFTKGFAMKLEFGALKGNRLPGKIYLCLPDDAHSCVAGVFNAEIRQPSQSRPAANVNASN
jgi:hypothetical protein